MEQNLFQAINGLAGKGGWADGFFVFLAKEAALIYGGLLLFLWFTKPGLRPFLWRAALAAVLGLMINALLGNFFYRPRPFLGGGPIKQLVPHAADASFPSDHTAVSFAVAGAIFPGRKGWGLFFFGLATLVALSRVYVGVHYPGDVAGGAFVGLGAAWLVERAWKLTRRNM